MASEDMDRIKQELDAIYNKLGLLRPEDVVSFAKNPKTALHDKFEWDNEKASHEYRLWQARRLIKLTFETVDQCEPTPVFVSLTSDRTEAGGGYRRTQDVLRSEDLREMLFQQALVEIRRFQARFRNLKEVAVVLAAMDAVEAKARKRKVKAV